MYVAVRRKIIYEKNIQIPLQSLILGESIDHVLTKEIIT